MNVFWILVPECFCFLDDDDDVLISSFDLQENVRKP